MADTSDSDFRSSTGQALTDAGWLDAHFTAARPEYEAMLRAVPITAGWRALDAGCGDGSYLPLLAAMVGPRGSVTACDLAWENVAHARVRFAATETAPTRLTTGSLTALPYRTDSFDVVWCANVSQYLTDHELTAALGEFRRVTRPGGLVAVKDVDMQLWRVHPADPLLIARLSDASSRAPDAEPQSAGSLRGRVLRRWLEAAGLEAVWQQTTLIERWAPLTPVERRFWAEWLSFLARASAQRDVPAADRATWRTLLDPAAPAHLVDHPDFYACEGQVVAVGRAPRD